MGISENREYVVVCNRHKSMFSGALLFLGYLTDDKEKRSFGGYTSDLDNCERYTLNELQENGCHFPIFNYKMNFYDFAKVDDVIIKKEDLLRFSEVGSAKIVYRK